jgi:hypothetical protein
MLFSYVENLLIVIALQFHAAENPEEQLQHKPFESQPGLISTHVKTTSEEPNLKTRWTLPGISANAEPAASVFGGVPQLSSSVGVPATILPQPGPEW